MTQPRTRHRATVTRETLARAVQPVAEPLVIDTTTCRCPNGPTTIGTFRNERLVAVERRHQLASRCYMPAENLDPKAWRAGR